MRYPITVLIAAGCLLLTGCHGGEDSDAAPAVTETAAAVMTGDTAADDTTAAPQTTTARPDPAARETTAETVSETAATDVTTPSASAEAVSTDAAAAGHAGDVTDDSADIMIGDDAPAPTQAASTEADPANETTSTAAAAPGVEDGAVLPDDGLDWTPLVPVG